jgi:hypothetical protein
MKPKLKCNQILISYLLRYLGDAPKKITISGISSSKKNAHEKNAPLERTILGQRSVPGKKFSGIVITTIVAESIRKRMSISLPNEVYL